MDNDEACTYCMTGDHRLVRLHHSVRVATGDDAAHNHNLVDGAGDGRSLLRRVSRRRAVRVGVRGAWSSSPSGCRRRYAGNRLQQPSLFRTPGTYQSTRSSIQPHLPYTSPDPFVPLTNLIRTYLLPAAVLRVMFECHCAALDRRRLRRHMAQH